MAFINIYTLIFLAELGDKTQLTAFTLAAQKPKAKWLIFVASSLALTASSFIAVVCGNLIAHIPCVRDFIRYVVVVLFLFFGILTIIEAGKSSDKCGDGENCSDVSLSLPVIFFRTFAMIFFAELGDKTQLAALSVSAGEPESGYVVFAASSCALCTTSLLAVLFGDLLSRIPKASAVIQYAAGVVFVVYGLIYLFT